MEQEIIKWIGTCFLTMSGIAVSINIKWATQWYAYAGFLSGHIIWSVFAVILEEWALLAMNIVFCLIDIYAIYCRIKHSLKNQIPQES